MKIDPESKALFTPLCIQGTIEKEVCGYNMNLNYIPSIFEAYELFIVPGSDLKVEDDDE